MSIHRPSHRWEDVAIVLMVMLMAVIIYIFDE
jgi:preprotein translocase subunit SecE